MATVTPNFNWPVPTSTDLVKDGATAIEALGDSIDASMAELKGGTTGQVLSKTSNTDMDFTWVAQDDSNAIQNSIVNAKGDLIGASANDTPAILSVGNNGEVLIADSSTSTGLRYQSNFAAGKNKIINGDFGIWQRGTSFTPNINLSTYCADRFGNSWSGTGTTTFSQQTFSPGTAPVAGYEGSFFLRAATSSGATYVQMNQPIEDVRTFAGQTVTLSFWAKSSSTFTTRPIIRQAFGSGGSANVDANLTDTTFTTSWARYSWTTTLASIAGKTIGTGSSLTVYFVNYQSGTIASNNIDVWGVQLEAGSVATAFQTATGTIQGELAACQRYFPVVQVNEATGYAYATNNAIYTIQFPVQARAVPTGMTIISGSAQAYALNVGYAVTPSFNSGSISMANIVSGSGITITAGQGSRIGNNFIVGFTGCEL